MYLHANAKLGLAGRVALVRAVEDGCSLKVAAAAFSVSPATAHRWWHRWLEAGEEARRTLSCLFDRSSRPHRSPRQLAPELAGGDLRLPPQDRLGAAAGRWRDRVRTLDCLEGAQAGGDLAAAASRRSRSRPTGTSGPAPAICSTWTPAATRASCGPAIASPATARSAHATGCVPRHGSVTTTCTPSSTTTPGSPTSSSTTTRKPRPSPASSNARSPSSTDTASPPSD